MDFKKTLLLALATTAMSMLPGCSSEQEKPIYEGLEVSKPNIVVIYADDVGYGDVGAYGSERIKTPNLDRLAENGIRFTNAYATSAMCTPSRYSLLTGRYAFRHPSAGILSAEDPMIIEPGSPTLPEILRGKGYRTSIVGKWHLGLGSEEGGINWNGKISPGPLDVGFDESFLLPVTNDRVPTVYVDGYYVYNLEEEDMPLQVQYPKEGHHDYQEEQFGKKGEKKPAVPQPLVGNLPSGHTHPEQLRYPADAQHSGTIVNEVSRIGYMAGGQSAWWDDETMAKEFANRSENFIRENKGQPFFLYLSLHQNHVARIPNSQFMGSSGTGLRGDAVQELDWVVGRVMAVLEEEGLHEKTIVIFSSDNGPVFYDGYEDGSLKDHNGHDPSGMFSGGKYVAYEGGTRMPTILSWPAVVEPGVSDALISQVDFLASFAELTGAKIPEGYNHDSENMLQAFLGRSDKGRSHLVLQSSDGLALRQGKWKYIAPGSRSDWAYSRHNLGDTPLNTAPLMAGEYLFNLEEDPGETTNLADKNPEKAKELAELLEQINGEYEITN